MFTASVHITVLNVYRGFMDCLVKKNAETTVTTVPDPTGIVEAVKLVFMVVHVQSVVLKNVKHVTLKLM